MSVLEKAAEVLLKKEKIDGDELKAILGKKRPRKIRAEP